MTKEVGEVRFVFKGSRELGQSYTGYGRNLLGILKSFSGSNKVNNLTRTLPDGTVVRVYSSHGQDKIEIDTQAVGVPTGGSDLGFIFDADPSGHPIILQKEDPWLDFVAMPLSEMVSVYSKNPGKIPVWGTVDWRATPRSLDIITWNTYATHASGFRIKGRYGSVPSGGPIYRWGFEISQAPSATFLGAAIWTAADGSRYLRALCYSSGSFSVYQKPYRTKGGAQASAAAMYRDSWELLGETTVFEEKPLIASHSAFFNSTGTQAVFTVHRYGDGVEFDSDMSIYNGYYHVTIGESGLITVDFREYDGGIVSYSYTYSITGDINSDSDTSHTYSDCWTTGVNSWSTYSTTKTTTSVHDSDLSAIWPAVDFKNDRVTFLRKGVTVGHAGASHGYWDESSNSTSTTNWDYAEANCNCGALYSQFSLDHGEAYRRENGEASWTGTTTRETVVIGNYSKSNYLYEYSARGAYDYARNSIYEHGYTFGDDNCNHNTIWYHFVNIDIRSSDYSVDYQRSITTNQSIVIADADIRFDILIYVTGGKEASVNIHNTRSWNFGSPTTGTDTRNFQNKTEYKLVLVHGGSEILLDTISIYSAPDVYSGPYTEFGYWYESGALIDDIFGAADYSEYYSGGSTSGGGSSSGFNGYLARTHSLPGPSIQDHSYILLSYDFGGLAVNRFGDVLCRISLTYKNTYSNDDLAGKTFDGYYLSTASSNYKNTILAYCSTVGETSADSIDRVGIL